MPLPLGSRRVQLRERADGTIEIFAGGHSLPYSAPQSSIGASRRAFAVPPCPNRLAEIGAQAAFFRQHSPSTRMGIGCATDEFLPRRAGDR